MKNYCMANKGMFFEREVIMANHQYKERGIALIQKISTPWKVLREGKKIISAFPEGKSTLDFRGTVSGGISISFDCKETTEEKGLPLQNIEAHQIEYMKKAIEVGEITFILCCILPRDKRFYIKGEVVINHWDKWQGNKRKHGYNYIPVEKMLEVRSKQGIVLNYLAVLDKE
ncbi:Holliday junction resolvase RecU [Clostridium formicaceticum]|uniref:Holliday junction resolvase RecU n=2 Tax=Clostridium formicaceticum TaxID=1497 RepID=A0AAC9RHI0_9CLOT|nr:Holliday junction resolvase RecU [Clostridium formicaceticum]ARE87094.1 Holliday junction resolvase RecU [Clostridium formicaceticum]